jgi:hypothetical protein
MAFSGALPFVLAKDDKISVTSVVADALDDVACGFDPACTGQAVRRFVERCRG